MTDFENTENKINLQTKLNFLEEMREIAQMKAKEYQRGIKK